MKKRKLYWKIWLGLLAGILIMNGLGCIPAFCDAYTDNVYPLLADGLGRLTALCPVAFGELLMYLGILLVLLSVVFLILLPFLRKKPGYRKFTAGYYKSFLMALTVLVLVYAFTWSVPFRGTVLGQGSTDKRTEFTYAEIDALMKYVTAGANQAAEEIEIGADETVDFPTESEYRALIETAMLGISDEFPRLKGYYPPVKTALCSDILNRMWIGGYTYPFTMEMTHSKYSAADPMYLPVLDAHEMSHHMGYYKENEANFLSQFALSRSDDPFMRLAGFSEMYQYLISDFDTAREQASNELAAQAATAPPSLDGMDIHETPKEEIKARIQEIMAWEEKYLGKYPELSERAHQIFQIARGIRHEVYEADAHPIDDMPAVDNVIQETADVGWETQAEILQENCYDGVTLLLLQYFDGKLY